MGAGDKTHLLVMVLWCVHAIFPLGFDVLLSVHSLFLLA